MKIKLDENLPSDLKEIDLHPGHDVHSVFDEALNGKPDALVWQACLYQQWQGGSVVLTDYKLRIRKA